MGIVLEMPKRTAQQRKSYSRMAGFHKPNLLPFSSLTAKLTGISLQNARLLPVRAHRQAHKKQEQFYLPLFLL